MTTERMNILVPPAAVPTLGAAMQARFARAGSPIWRALGLKWLLPALSHPAPRDGAGEAASVRELASTYLRTDPGFAADLYAAADRHERIDSN